MTDSYKPTQADSINMGTSAGGAMPNAHDDLPPSTANETSRTLLAGVVGGIVSAAGYLIYARLPDDQRDRLHSQVRNLAETRLNELRSRFNL